jgi:hypothetical protein
MKLPLTASSIRYIQALTHLTKACHKALAPGERKPVRGGEGRGAERKRSTYDAIGGVGGEGELVVGLVVLVVQICGESAPRTISKSNEQKKNQ